MAAPHSVPIPPLHFEILYIVRDVAIFCTPITSYNLRIAIDGWGHSFPRVALVVLYIGEGI